MAITIERTIYRPRILSEKIKETTAPKIQQAQAENQIYIFTESEYADKIRLFSQFGIIPHEITYSYPVNPDNFEPVSKENTVNQQLEIWAFPGINKKNNTIAAIEYKSEEQLTRDGVKIVSDPLPERIKNKSRDIKQALIDLALKPISSPVDYTSE